MTTLSLMGSLAVGTTLLLSGVFKISDIPLSEYTIRRLRVFPTPLDEWIGRLLPLAEILIGILLVIGWGGRITTLCALGLTLVFGLASLQAIYRKEEVACNCFGSALIGRLGTGSLLHAVLLSVLLIAVFLAPNSALPFLVANSWMTRILLLLPAACLVQLGFVLRLADIR